MPMFRVKIETTNAAFDGNLENELPRILREMADRIERGSAPTSWTVRDLNGNTVGKAGFGR